MTEQVLLMLKKDRKSVKKKISKGEEIGRLSVKQSSLRNELNELLEQKSSVIDKLIDLNGAEIITGEREKLGLTDREIKRRIKDATNKRSIIEEKIKQKESEIKQLEIKIKKLREK